MEKQKIEKVGLKDDNGKLRIDLVTPEVIEGMAEVLTFGAKKYKPNSWQNVEDGENKHYASVMRHLLSYRKGEKLDKETGLSHIKHALTNLMFILYHEENNGNN